MPRNRGPPNVLFHHGALYSQSCEEPAALHLLLPLEEIELRLANRLTVPFIRDDQRADMPAALKPFIAARRQAGRPVKMSWNEELALPSVYCYCNAHKEVDAA